MRMRLPGDQRPESCAAKDRFNGRELKRRELGAAAAATKEERPRITQRGLRPQPTKANRESHNRAELDLSFLVS